jgi:hypothetical protein
LARSNVGNRTDEPGKRKYLLRASGNGARGSYARNNSDYRFSLGRGDILSDCMVRVFHSADQNQVRPRGFDWVTIVWSVWTAVLFVALAYVALFAK